ncbi:tRNA lysidine(34) synthetase TilS [Anoxynatronum buryatiense]|uniref:tRNA(Ile)-lysidine synthase n=1 Tax=Anoxynatronum buryatiense TaxID=489973 RepID=A0AA45X031_9CLOT|nr:tRNA lysidine(34) synthetase TilS [Anoxynatronum buryatiense]SMP70360.1 tRNA(Ile)-lysidine synthase [Anoxynatronum buryatiense]
MTTTIEKKILQSALFQPGDRILVGLSGGPDSVCLLHALAMLGKKWPLTLYAAHLNHNLRGMAANRDAAFAMRFARQMGVHCVVKSEDVGTVAREKRLSVETAARLCRYEFLNEVAERIEADWIAVAHHQNDQAETLLMNLLRGSGLKGLGGMAPCNGKVIRPLLEVSRDEVMAYCAHHQLDFCQDETNEMPEATRNKIRLELMPHLAVFNPEIVSNLGRTATLLREDEAALNQLAEEAMNTQAYQEESSCQYENEALNRLPDALLSRVLRNTWQQMTTTTHTLTYRQVKQAVGMIRNPVQEKWLHWPGDIYVKITWKKTIFMPKAEKPETTTAPMPPVLLKRNGVTWLPRGRGSVFSREMAAGSARVKRHDPHCQVIAADDLTQDLVMRSRRPGDRWNPMGMNGSKTIKKTLVDAKVQGEDRENCLLLCHGETILWVTAWGISEGAALRPETKRTLVLEYRPEG